MIYNTGERWKKCRMDFFQMHWTKSFLYKFVFSCKMQGASKQTVIDVRSSILKRSSFTRTEKYSLNICPLNFQWSRFLFAPLVKILFM